MPSGRRRLLLDDSDGLAALCPLEAFSAALGRRSVDLVRGALAPGDVRLLLGPSESRDGPAVRLLEGARPGLWRVTEEHGRGDARRARLFDHFGEGLGAATIAAAAILPGGSPPTRGPGVASGARDGPAGGKDPRADVAEADPHALSGRGALVAPADAVAVGRALAAGREVVTFGPGGWSETGLVRAAKDAAQARALAAEAPLHPRNRRDAARRHLAVELLMNTVRPEPEALADLVADAVLAVSRRRPTVSIVITNHDYAPYLGAAIESALDQTLPAREVVVVDDGSMDGSRDVIASHPDVTAILKDNGGQASAFNAGAAAAGGDVVIFLDADDVLMPDAVAAIAEEDFTGVSRLSFALEIVDAAGTPTGLFPTSRRAEEGDLRGRLLHDGHLSMMPTSGNVFPRAVLDALLPMPEAPWRVSADVYLAFGAAFLGRIRHLDRALGRYRVHGRNAYYATFGAEANFDARKLAQRRRALLDVAGAMAGGSRFGSAREAAALRAVAARLGAGGAALARLRAALEGGHGLWRRPALPRLPLGGRRRRPRPSTRRLLAERSPPFFGGPCAWPVLAPGAEVALRPSRAARALLGHGWALTRDGGARADRGAATLGFELPGPRADWCVVLDHAAAEGEAQIVGRWVNGTGLGPARLGPSGRLVLRISAELLVPVDGGPGHRVGVLLETLRPEGPPLALTGLRLERVLPTGAGAPVLPLGRPIATRAGADGARFLAEGWAWADARGVGSAAAEACLRFSVAEETDLSLHLACDPPPVMVCVDDAAARTTPDAAGRGILVPIPRGAVGPDGGVRVAMLAPSDGTPLRLTGLRLDRDCGPAGRLIPGRWVARADLDAVEGPGGRLSVHARASAPSAPRLLVGLEPASDAAAPRTADIRVADRRLRAVIGAPALVPIALDDAGPRPVELRMRLDTGLRLTGLAQDPSWSPSTDDGPPAAWTYDADALANLVTDAADWEASDGALWLAAERGSLALPAPPSPADRLVVTVLTLPGTGQRLRLGVGSRWVEGAAETGPTELRVPLGRLAPSAAVRMSIATNGLVGAETLGLGTGGLLGGAIVRLAFEADAPSAPQGPASATNEHVG